MITPFQVYLVMQLDDLRAAMVFFGFFIFMAGIYIARTRHDQTRRVGFIGPTAILLGFALLCVSAATPSSKTAAAMLILPALTSDKVTEPLTAEAKELYGLAKSALSNLAEKKAEKVEPEKAK